MTTSAELGLYAHERDSRERVPRASNVRMWLTLETDSAARFYDVWAFVGGEEGERASDGTRVDITGVRDTDITRVYTIRTIDADQLALHVVASPKSWQRDVLDKLAAKARHEGAL